MRFILGLGLCATGLAASCSSYTIAQCASDCACQRVACCCGAGCDKTGTTENYNQCVPANSPYEQWTGCPATTACAASNGLVRTITPCVVPTPAPTPGVANSNGAVNIPFGTTFPMIGTQALSHQTWQQNVYMGTDMQFNPGAYWGYTNSYNVPNWNAAGGSGSSGSGGNNGAPSPAPTPADATGQPCYSYSQPCPSGYYCKLTTGYNTQQQGVCAAEAGDTWNGGAGKFTDSSYYTGLTHPPLVLDPNHDGAASPYGSGAYGSAYGSGAYGSGGGAYGVSGYGGASGVSGYGGASGVSGYGGAYGSVPGANGPESCAPLPTGVPVCGYKSFAGSCFCDTDCASKGDCCADYAQFCGVLSPQDANTAPPPNLYPPYSPPATSATGSPYVPAQPYSPPATSAASSGNCDPVGQCGSLCGSSNPAVGVNGKPCYCDSQCSISGDCCCSSSQCSL